MRRSIGAVRRRMAAVRRSTGRTLRSIGDVRHRLATAQRGRQFLPTTTYPNVMDVEGAADMLIVKEVVVAVTHTRGGVAPRSALGVTTTSGADT